MPELEFALSVDVSLTLTDGACPPSVSFAAALTASNIPANLNPFRFIFVFHDLHEIHIYFELLLFLI